MRPLVVLLTVVLLVSACNAGPSTSPTNVIPPSPSLAALTTAAATNAPTTLVPTNTIASLAVATALATWEPSASPTPTRTRTPQPTQTPIPSLATTSTATPWAARDLTPTLTYDPAVHPTLTPAPAAQCPTITSSPLINLTLDKPLDGQLVEALNAGGSVEALAAAVHAVQPESSFNWNVKGVDVTNDGVPEVLVIMDSGVMAPGDLYIFGCADGAYHRLAWWENLGSPNLTIADLNADGMPELIVDFNPCGADVCGYDVQIREWDGTSFKSLIDEDVNSSVHAVTGVYVDEGHAGGVNGGYQVTNTAGRNTQELVLTSGPYFVSCADAGTFVPRRSTHVVLTWNGTTFAPSVLYDPPIYRFQAVADGDRLSLLGDYTRALAAYQQGIFDEELAAWNSAWLGYASPNCVGSYGVVMPTLSPSDATERPRLEAYSRYRIMLLHVVQHHLPEAKIVYDTLQKKFPAGKPGRPYAEVASVFWNAYQTAQDLGVACGQASAYAQAQADDILKPLGSAYYGSPQPDYKPEDICPFEN